MFVAHEHLIAVTMVHTYIGMHCRRETLYAEVQLKEGHNATRRIKMEGRR